MSDKGLCAVLITLMPNKRDTKIQIIKPGSVERTGTLEEINLALAKALGDVAEQIERLRQKRMMR